MLVLVATPIGNLGDISQRALAALESADVVVSEDTRKTGFLLTHFSIKKPQISFREDNEQRVLPKIMDILTSGKNVALVTDAGTPSISDPGFILVRSAIATGIEVSAVPGPTVHSFTFRGFPPRKSGPRKRWMEIDQKSPHTLIFYESPHRLVAFLRDALEVYGDRSAVIANDLTKKFETLFRGSLSELIAEMEKTDLKGEFAVVIASADYALVTTSFSNE
jgi:16S rRNA (cytidine1402-2'-O)-methyltransferase